jgi:hypothetical protein
LADHDPAAVEGPGRAPEALALPHARHRVGVALPGAHAREGGEGGRSAHGVAGETGIALKLENGPLSVLAEDAVDTTGVEPQRAQAALEVGDVVASERGRGVVEQPVGEAVAGFDQRAPRLGPADAVDPQPPLLLEAANRGLGAGREAARLVAAGGVPGCGQACLQVADGLARRSLPQQGFEAAAYRNSASSWVS